jgi:hypothetical protein
MAWLVGVELSRDMTRDAYQRVGQIYQADVKLVGDMTTLNARLARPQGSSEDVIQVFTLETRPSHILLTLPDGTEFGYLRDNMTKALEPLLRGESLEFEGIAMLWRLRDRINKASRSIDALVHVNINIYGPRSMATSVGKELSSHKVWLQKPDHFKRQLSYDNPQMLRFPDLDHSLLFEPAHDEVISSRTVHKEDRLAQMVSEVYGSLQRANELGSVSGDRRLRTALLQ